jgi:hypothetical protein
VLYSYPNRTGDTYPYVNCRKYSVLTLSAFICTKGDLKRRSEDSVVLKCPLTGEVNPLSAAINSCASALKVYIGGHPTQRERTRRQRFALNEQKKNYRPPRLEDHLVVLLLLQPQEDLGVVPDPPIC